MDQYNSFIKLNFENKFQTPRNRKFSQMKYNDYEAMLIQQDQFVKGRW